MADRGYFPLETYDALQCEEGGELEDPEGVYSLAEEDCLPIFDLRARDQDAYLACAGEALLAKLLSLIETIG